MLFPSFFNASAGGYEIEQSLRFDRASSHYLNETFSAGQTTWTVSFWVKRANLNGVVQCLFGTSTNGFYNDLGFEGSDRLRFRQVYSGVPSENFEMVSTMRFRDPSAWYHIVLSYGAHDGSAAADRAKIWVNNQRLTAFDTANYPGANVSSLLNANNRVHNIGKVGFYDDYLGAYIAEFNFIDGQRLDPTDFGEEDNNGVWRPIKFAGTYGNNNSVYLKFDPTATNGIGHDHSGNSNHWSPTGFDTNPTSYVLATKTSGTFSTGTLRDVFDASSGAAGGVYQEATTGSTAASTIDIEFDSPLSGTITVEASDGTGGTNNGGQYQLIDSTDTVQVTQARPTNTTTFTHTGLSDITKLRMYGGSSGLGGILISRFESSDQTIRSADWLALTDVMSDTPTTNWCTLNPLQTAIFSSAVPTITNGNLVTENGGSGWSAATGTIAVSSGKWYWEYTCSGVTASEKIRNGVYKQSGVLSATGGDIPSSSDVHTYASDGTRWNGSSFVSYGATYTSGDTIGVALDLDAGTLVFYKNNTSQGTAYTGLSGTYSPYFAQSTDPVSTVNFGQRDFAYTPPTGFKPLNTSNLPAPTVKDGSDYFNTVLYTGNGSTQSITGVGFQSDFTWIKTRSVVNGSHALIDAVRGATKVLKSQSTAAEGTFVNSLTSFDADGFSVGSEGFSNYNTANLVAWNWLAGNGTSTNTVGSITSTVSANPSAGFSIVSYGGNSTAGATVGHGLGVAPKAFVIKNRDDSVARWCMYHVATGATGYMRLDASPKFIPDGVFNSTAPSSTTFTLGSGYYSNRTGDDYIAYCFAEVENYSRISSYLGNGSTDGPFVYCGFRPAWVMIKDTTSDGNSWYISDNKRNTYNVVNGRLLANEANGESTSVTICDFTANGFKIRTNDSGWNTSGSKYLFLCFASNPFGGDGVSPATAR